MVSWTKGDPWTTAVNQFPKLKAHVSKENMQHILYKNTTDNQQLVQLPFEVNVILHESSPKC